jgi:hypothetical protein
VDVVQVPIVRGVPRKDAKAFGGLSAFTSNAELINVSMLFHIRSKCVQLSCVQLSLYNTCWIFVAIWSHLPPNVLRLQGRLAIVGFACLFIQVSLIYRMLSCCFRHCCGCAMMGVVRRV